jgi:hemolysin activation/secretion protein
MHRDADSKTRAHIALTRKKNENFIEDVVIDTSSRTLAIAELGLQHEQNFSSGGLLVSEVIFERGLDAFGSPDDDLLLSPDNNQAKAQFDKYSLSFDFQ